MLAPWATAAQAIVATHELRKNMTEYAKCSKANRIDRSAKLKASRDRGALHIPTIPLDRFHGPAALMAAPVLAVVSDTSISDCRTPHPVSDGCKLSILRCSLVSKIISVHSRADDVETRC